jgi:hypothetical protein
MAAEQQLIYLVYGPDRFYREALFSVISALLRSRDRSRLNIVVYCQQAHWFADLPVATEPITEADLEQWAGAIGYNHRSKPCLMRRALPRAEKTALIDTDTFFLQAPEQLFERIERGCLLVDQVNHSWRDEDNDWIYRYIGPYLDEYPVDDAMPVVNSGVIGLTRHDSALIDDTIALIDRVYLPARKTFTVEQVALGIAAYRQYEFRAQQGVFKHYWSRKQLYRAKADAFLAAHRADPLSEAALADLALIIPYHPKPKLWPRLRYKLRLLRYPPRHRHLYLELLYGAHPYANKFDRAVRKDRWDKAIASWQKNHDGSEQELQALHEAGALREVLGDNYPDFVAFDQRRIEFRRANKAGK